ncbi:MAG TPA: hypothetical protein VI114_12160 [Chthoniobacterales bacterium]|jgi:hypothetical protein
MTVSRYLNLLGLVISLIAAALMYFFPLYTTPIVRDKKTTYYAEAFTLTSHLIKVPSWKVLVARLGPICLEIGFLLQIIAALVDWR